MRQSNIITCVLILLICSCSPKLSSSDYKSRKNADNIIEKFFLSDVKDCNYVIFSVAEEDFIVIIEKNDIYEEFFYNKKNNYKSEKIILSKTNKIFEKMFNKKLYQKEYITFNSKFFKPQYEISSGNITYFTFKDKKAKRFGEARLSFFIKPNPIDSEVYSYLTRRILDYQ